MNKNWRQYLDEDYEDSYEKVERIPHKPKRKDEDKPELKRPNVESTKNTKN